MIDNLSFESVGNHIRNLLWGSVWHQVRGPSWRQVNNPIMNQVRGQVWDRVKDQVSHVNYD